MEIFSKTDRKKDYNNVITTVNRTVSTIAGRIKYHLNKLKTLKWKWKQRVRKKVDFNVIS